MTIDDFKGAIATRAYKTAAGGATIIGTKEDGWIFDFCSVLLDPEWLNAYAEIFWEKNADLYPFQVCGLETTSIALVSAVVMKSKERGTPVNGVYIRKSRAKHDLPNQIEGVLDGHPVVIVDDIINSGKSINYQMEVLKAAEKRIARVFVLLRYRALDAYDFFGDTEFSSLFSLSDFGHKLREKNTDVPRKNDFEILWRFKSEKPSYEHVVQKSAPVIDSERVFFGSDQGIFWALNQHDGSVAWQKRIGFHPKGKGIFSSPAYENGVVYFGGYDGNLYALDARTGKEKWVNFDADWIGSSPSVASDIGLVYVGLEFSLRGKQGGISAVSLDTGNTHWMAEAPSLTHGSPLYIQEEKRVVIGSNNGLVYCYTAEDGALAWSYQTGGAVKARFAYDPVRRLIIFGSHDSFVYALHVKDGALAWRFKTGATIYSTPLIVGESVYVSSLDKSLYALALRDGVLEWSFRSAGRMFASPVYVRDSLWIGSNDGRLYELERQSGKLKSFFQATERITNAITYNKDTDRLFVPTFANEIYCLKRSV